MIREKYTKLRTENELGQICYEFYKEKAKKKNLEVYDINFFIKAFNVWMTLDSSAIKVATSHYDALFEVQILMSGNKEIKYI